MAKIDMKENGILLVSLYGELDNFEANRIRNELTSAIFSGHVTMVIWDLEKLNFMDSSGIGLILGRMRDLSPFNGETVILNPSPTMEKIFSFAGLDRYIQHCSVNQLIGKMGGVLFEK